MTLATRFWYILYGFSLQELTDEQTKSSGEIEEEKVSVRRAVRVISGTAVQLHVCGAKLCWIQTCNHVSSALAQT